jgi:aspartyl-tRNA(Asn)/glutamyl-tRNA(Gln) amidotransferase subunit C
VGVKIDISEVRRIANLASLEFEEAELPRLAEQLSSILTYMESLRRLDTSSVAPTFHSLEHEGPLREDVPRPGLGAEEATRGAPGDSRGQFLVPRIIG